MRVANYSRTSTTAQRRDKAFSADEQIRILRDYCKQYGYTIVHEVIENESASQNGLDRPELNRIRNLARQGLIDAIVVYDLSRLTRDVVDGVILYREFRQYNVQIISIKENVVTDDNQIMYIFTCYQNQEYVRQQREKSMIGFRAKVESGIIPGNGGAVYGYDLVGRRKESHLEINEPRAIIVRSIFRWYAIDGHRIVDIATKLTEMRVETPGEVLGKSRTRERGVWADSTVRDILRNSTYGGIFYAFKLQKVNGKLIPRPKDQWIAIDVPAIVPKELWQMANDKMDKGKIESPRNKKYQYLASGRFRCACGGSISGATGYERYAYYRCNSRLSATTRPSCGSPYMAVPIVDSAIWHWVIELLEHPRAILTGYQTAQSQMQEKTQHLRNQLAIIDTELGQYQAKLERLLDAIADGTLPRDIIKKRADEYKAFSADLLERRATLEKELSDNTLSDGEIQLIIGSLEQYRQQILDAAHDAEFDTKQEVVKALGLNFTLAVEDGSPVLYIKWLLNSFRIEMFSDDYGYASGSGDGEVFRAEMADRMITHISSKSLTFRVPLNV